MKQDMDIRLPDQEAEVGELLAATIGGVVSAQERLDHYSEDRRRAYEEAPEGSLALPPLSFVFKNVAVELELSASVARTDRDATTTDSAETRLLCRTLNPTSVSLYGHSASAGLRVRVHVAPLGPLMLKDAGRSPVASQEDPAGDALANAPAETAIAGHAE